MAPVCGSALRATTTPSTSREGARLLEDELALERVPGRGLAAGHELPAERPACVLGDVSVGSSCDSIPSATGTWIARSRTSVPPCAVDDLLHGLLHALVRAADEEHGDLLAGEPVAQDGVVRALDVPLLGLPFPRALLGRVEVVLQPSDLLAQGRVVDAPVELRVRDRDADEDPEHEREEDGRQRDDVVAEVEHSAGL